MDTIIETTDSTIGLFGGLAEFSVIWDETESVFRMWDTGYKDSLVFDGELQEFISARLRCIGYAHSRNGVDWTPYAGNPVIVPVMANTLWKNLTQLTIQM